MSKNSDPDKVAALIRAMGRAFSETPGNVEERLDALALFAAIAVHDISAALGPIGCRVDSNDFIEAVRIAFRHAPALARQITGETAAIVEAHRPAVKA